MSESKIIVPAATIGINLTSAKSPKQRLTEHPLMMHWWQFDNEYATMSGGALARVSSIKGGLDVAFGSEGGALPALNPIGAYGLDPDGVPYPAVAQTKGVNQIGIVSAQIDLSETFSVLVFGRDPGGATNQIFKHGTVSGTATRLQAPSADAQWQFFSRGGGINIADAPGADALPRLRIGVSAPGQIKGRSNRGAISVGAVSGASPGLATVRLFALDGSDYGFGDWADIMIFSSDVLDPSNAPLLDLIYEFFEGAYFDGAQLA